jgi:dTDP-4-dehydrorhamnose 3,5-epimerase
MKFKELKVKGSYKIDLEKSEDTRGFFSRVFCKKEFKKKKIRLERFVQFNTSVSKKKGTLRGLHYQSRPWQEDKLIRCINGEVFNVVVDLRKKSKTYLKWDFVILNNINRSMMLVPKGCANGHITIKDNSEIIYFCSQFYKPEYERGIRFDDKIIDIKWPARIKNISFKDLNWPNYKK